jgi:hypothetical protein
VQAGQLLWQLLFLQDSKAAAKKQEALKADVLGAAAANFAAADRPEAAPAAGVLAVLAAGAEADQDAVLSARPPVATSIQRALASRSVSLIAATCCLLRVLAVAPAARARLLRTWKDWDWEPLLHACQLPVRQL